MLGVCVGFVLYVLGVSAFVLYLLGRFIRAVVLSLIVIQASILVFACPVGDSA